MDYIIDLDHHWKNVEKWFNDIKINNNIFSDNYIKVTAEIKSKFTIKFLFFIKTILNIDDINTLDKIILNNYDIDILIKNLYDTNYLFYLEGDIELKNIIIYLSRFSHYFNDIKNKIIEILKPILDDENCEKILNNDDDLTRFTTIIGLIISLYLKKKNIKKALEDFLKLNIIFIQFFIISYLILDNLMDNKDENEVNIKNNFIFFKWFMNIIKNPDQEIILDEEQSLIWQCITFKKYFLLFRNEYPYQDNIFIYNYVKIMIDTLNKSHKIQKNNNNITEREVLEITFKKSYVVILFLAFISFKQLNYNFTKKDIKIISKIAFLIQLCDDFIDIDKDIEEGNTSYFTLNISNNDKIDNKIKKIVSVFYIFINELNEKNKNIYNLYHYIFKNLLITTVYLHNDKINNDLLNNFYEYSFFTPHVLQYFDKNTYDIYKNSIFLNFIKKMIKNF